MSATTTGRARGTGAPAGVAALQLRALSAGYGRTTVLHGVDLRVAAGEVVALLGPNGAGKTTLLGAVAGLLPAQAGAVEIAGAAPAGPLHRRVRAGLACVPEGRALFPALTVSEHLRLAGGRRATLLDEVLELLPELVECRHRRAGLLSGGQQQMLALARALLSQPRLLLVDELSMGLAPVIVQRLLPVLRTTAERHGTGVLFVEQHVAAALSVADRAYVLSHGRIVLHGTAVELAGRRDLLAASYLGEQAVVRS